MFDFRPSKGFLWSNTPFCKMRRCGRALAIRSKMEISSATRFTWEHSFRRSKLDDYFFVSKSFPVIKKMGAFHHTNEYCKKFEFWQKKVIFVLVAFYCRSSLKWSKEWTTAMAAAPAFVLTIRLTLFLALDVYFQEQSRYTILITWPLKKLLRLYKLRNEL